MKRFIKAAFIITTISVIAVSILEDNILPIVFMSVGVLFGPLAAILAGLIGITLTYIY